MEISLEQLGRFLGWIVMFVVLSALAYSLGAFVAWEYNPGHWDPFSRVFTLIVGFVGFLVWSGLIRLAEREIIDPRSAS